MNLWIYLPFFLYFTNVVSVPHKKPTKKYLTNHSIYEISTLKSNMITHIQKKAPGFLNIIRYKNILPTTFLSFTGGWIINPSLGSLIHSPIFIVGILNTIGIMSSSMIINDIFDRKLDKINNPTRPLITGEVSLKEAILYNIGIVGFTELLSMKYLPSHLQMVIHLALLNITLYTPFLKRILLVKNISCASLVAFGMYFSGLTIQTAGSLSIYKNTELLQIATRSVFFGSLLNELLLDIRDYQGDRENHIYTFPVVFGFDRAWRLASLILHVNILWNALHIMKLYGNIYFAAMYFVIFLPILQNLFKLKNTRYSREPIIKMVNETNMPLFSLLFFLSIIAKYMKK
uniref:UbiA prenyltransferase family protein n=1 Tax=viral metagenome TaxID=1070528 RepID=A0A6C0LNP8_9ZZZZ